MLGGLSHAGLVVDAPAAKMLQVNPTERMPAFRARKAQNHPLPDANEATSLVRRLFPHEFSWKVG
jgi:hypothetical protein